SLLPSVSLHPFSGGWQASALAAVFGDNFSRPTGSLRHPQKRNSRNHLTNYQKTIYTENVTAPTATVISSPGSSPNGGHAELRRQFDEANPWHVEPAPK
ncbi:MAG TPA: hypothetical protein VH325_05250, partial [Bryobacteraceae bacterium]|nr:hypothetical protein [Bryobacteraceae bacterium]